MKKWQILVGVIIIVLIVNGLFWLWLGQDSTPVVKVDFEKMKEFKNDLIEFPKSISCSSWKETKCDFVIWKQIAGKVISETIIQELLKKGKTDVLQGFKSREGNPFSAKLVLSNNKVVFS